MAAQKHTRVDIGGRSLDVVRAGAGGPTVVFEVGLADSLEDWNAVWPTVAENTSVVLYSRAGFGRSDPSPDNSARHEMTDLHELLHRMNVHMPVVLVGRSYGGLLSRLYTSLYPEDVAGIVLVDATHERQVKAFGAVDPKYPVQFRAYFDSVLTTLPRGAEAAETRETVRIQAAGAVDGMKPLPDIPIAVITSMKSDESAQYVNGTARGHEVWRALHDEWFHDSRDAIHIETTHSGHDIQNSEPGLVVNAIRFVLDRVRAR